MIMAGNNRQKIIIICVYFMNLTQYLTECVSVFGNNSKLTNGSGKI